MENRPKLRVLVDWDNDGFFNTGVPEGAPLNLLPYPAYCANLFPKNQPSSGVLADATYTEDIDTLGLLKMDFNVSAGFPSYFGVNLYSTSTNYLVTNSTYLLEPNKDYYLSFYIKGANNVDIKIYRGTLNSTTETLLTTISNVTITNWIRIDYQIADVASLSNFFVTVERTGGGNTTFSVKGVQLVEGTVNSIFNTGEMSPYDNIADYVLTASWELGRKDYDEPIAYEGTARIKLNNDDKRFSPANTTSPFYNQLNQNLMIAIEYEQSANNWVRLWTGWTAQFKALPGRTGTRQAEIVCKQGIYRLRDGELDYKLEDKLLVNDAILTILENSGFRSAYYPLLTTLNFDALLGWNSWLQNVSKLFSALSTSYRYIDLVGFGWGRKTSPAEALEDILEAEHSKLYIDRAGGLVLKHREDYANTVASYNLNLGEDVQRATYKFGEDIVNQVNVFIKPRKEVTNATIWTTKDPISIRGHVFGDGRQELYTKYIDLHFEFEEGKQKTITQIDGKTIDDMIVHVYTRNPRLYDNPTQFEVSAVTWDGEIHATVLGSESLKKKLQVRNNLEFPVWIDIEIKGSYVEGSEGGIFVYNDTDSQKLIRSVQSEKIELVTTTTEQEAQSFADFLLHRKSLPIGEFTNIVIKDDPTIKIGDVLSITEEQTGEVNRRHVVIGEKGDYAAGMILEIEYELARLDEQKYFTVSSKTEYSTINAVQNLLDKMSASQGVWEKVSLITPEGDSAYKLNGGNSGASILCYGNIEGNHWLNHWRNSHSNVIGGINFYTGFKHHSRARRLGTPYGLQALFDKANEEYYTHYDGSKISSPLFDNYDLQTGYNLVRFGAIVNANSADVRIESSTAGNTTPFGTTLHTVGTTVRPVTYLTNAASIGGGDVVFWADPLVAADTDIMFGDFTILHFPTLVTEDLGLLENTNYYLTLWTIANAAYDLHVIVVGEDGTPIYNAVLNVAIGTTKNSILFTTQTNNAKKHAIILYPTTQSDITSPNTKDLYIYGIAITKTIPNDYTSTNKLQNSLPVMYL